MFLRRTWQTTSSAKECVVPLGFYGCHWLTYRGQTPFRETHHISGRAVALAESRKVQLNELSLKDFQGLSEKFSDDVHQVFDFEASVERRNAIGGTSREMVERQVSVLRKAVSQ